VAFAREEQLDLLEHSHRLADPRSVLTREPTSFAFGILAATSRPLSTDSNGSSVLCSTSVGTRIDGSIVRRSKWLNISASAICPPCPAVRAL
jgi:hypothetical protein